MDNYTKKHGLFFQDQSNKPLQEELHPVKKTGRKGRLKIDTPSGHFWEMGYDIIRKRRNGDTITDCKSREESL